MNAKSIKKQANSLDSGCYCQIKSAGFFNIFRLSHLDCLFKKNRNVVTEKS